MFDSSIAQPFFRRGLAAISRLERFWTYSDLQQHQIFLKLTGRYITSHMLHLMNLNLVAEGLEDFFSRHSLYMCIDVPSRSFIFVM